MQLEKRKRKNQSWKSLYLSCHRHFPCRPSSSSSSNDDRNSPINPISLHKKPPLLLANSEVNEKKSPQFSRNKTTQMQWLRVSELERELSELEEWLHIELTRLRSHFGSYFNPNISNNNGDFCAKKKVNFDGKLQKLDGDDGGYLYSLDDGMWLVCGGSSSQDLVIKFSSPTIVPLEYGSNIFEVLNQMEKMPRDNLTAWLLKSSPMTNLSSNNKPPRQTISKVPRDFEEAVLKNAVSSLGELVIQGLRIQMGVKEVKKPRKRERQNEGKTDDHYSSKREEFTDGDGIIMAMLIQSRDPQKENQAIHNTNEMMVGFVEVEDDKESGFLKLGQIHVAQFRARRRNRNGHVMYGCSWCISMSS